MRSRIMKRFRICCETRSIQVQCREFVHRYTGHRYNTTACPSEDSDPTRVLLQLCVDAYYVAPGQVHRDAFQRGVCCHYGPLGVELKKHLVEQWWGSVQRSRTQVFGISTLTTSDDQSGVGHPMLNDERLKHLLDAEDLNKAQLMQRIQMLLRQSTPLRANLLQGTAQPVSCKAIH